MPLIDINLPRIENWNDLFQITNPVFSRVMNEYRELELSPAQMDAMVQGALERLQAFLKGLETAAVDRSDELADDVVRSFAEPLPGGGSDFESLLKHIFEDAAPYALNPASPGFLGYVPGGGLFHAAVADLMSDVLNRYVGTTSVAPALVQIESNVIRWFCDMMGYPGRARGFLTSGGSLANLSALITARHVRLGEAFSDAVIYISNQAHHCLEKAARFAGFPDRNFRPLPVDHRFRLDLGALREEIRADRKSGLKPFLVAGSAGTTNTGAIDPLTELADIAAEENLWFHVDGAYGGFFAMTSRGREQLAGLDRADSVVLDPHKTLFLPYGTGALLVRNGEHLKQTHTSEADYMPSKRDDDLLMDFCELSPELTRPFRGLRVWLPFKMHGAAAFERYLDEKLDLAEWLCARLKQMPELEVLAEPQLSILAFAVRGSETVSRNMATRTLIEAVNARQNVHLTGTTLNGLFAIRVAIVAFRTHKDRIEMLLADLRAELDQLTLPDSGAHPQKELS